MADNVELNQYSGGDVIASDDVGGVQYQRCKISVGADGTANDASTTNPLPVVLDVIDEVSGALTTVDFAHHEMHEGDHYFIKTYIVNAGGSGTSNYCSFTTPNSSKRIHFRASMTPDVDFTILIYEDGTASAGTPLTGVNNDRDSISAADLSALLDPDIDGLGNLIWSARNGGGKNPVGVSPAANYEVLAKTNSTYIFKITKNIAQQGIVDVDFFWYEHTDSA